MEGLAKQPLRADLWGAYCCLRGLPEVPCAPLRADDHPIKSRVETTPPKWHLDHIAWCFRAFVLALFRPDYRAHDERSDYRCGSCAESVRSIQRWPGAIQGVGAKGRGRLPTDAEPEAPLEARPIEGNFLDRALVHPTTDSGQCYDDLWKWTLSADGPCPGFKPLAGALGEDNAKVICSQMAPRGGGCLTSREHIWSRYRNFYHLHKRRPFTGIRLAQDAA